MSRNTWIAVVAFCTVWSAPKASATEYFLGGLSGGQVPTGSTATGAVAMEGDSFSLTVDLAFQGLVSTDVAAHIHCCAAIPSAAPVAITLAVFPIGVTSGSYSRLFDMSSSATYNATFLGNSGGTAGGAAAVLYTGLKAGQAYVDIHTTLFPGGEIRSYPLGIFVNGFESGDPLAWSAYPGWS